MEDKLISQGVQGGFASIASAFVLESIEHIIPWLLVMLMVIVTDLICGVRKSLLMGDTVRFSRAIRATMGKMVTYFAFVIMVCMINTAMGGAYQIDKWACLLVCFIEGCSIIGNILKPKGINFSMLEAMKVFLSKTTRVEKDDLDGVFTNYNNHEENKSTQRPAKQ